jgi:hypothetical protein
LYIFRREPGPFRFELKRAEFVSRGEAATRLLRNYRRPVFLHEPNYDRLQVITDGREVLELVR